MFTYLLSNMLGYLLTFRTKNVLLAFSMICTINKNFSSHKYRTINVHKTYIEYYDINITKRMKFSKSKRHYFNS